VVNLPVSFVEHRRFFDKAFVKGFSAGGIRGI
jgi:hypothetical protein